MASRAPILAHRVRRGVADKQIQIRVVAQRLGQLRPFDGVNLVLGAEREVIRRRVLAINRLVAGDAPVHTGNRREVDVHMMGVRDNLLDLVGRGGELNHRRVDHVLDEWALQLVQPLGQ